MPNSNNPYESPRSASDLNAGNQRHLGIIAGTALVGGLATAVALYFIYISDPRTGTSGPSIEFVIFAGGGLSSVIWAASGWFQRNGIIGLAITITVASATTVLWVAIGGTYADVVAAAASVGWPCGGLAASVGQYLWSRSTRRLASLDGTNN